MNEIQRIKVSSLVWVGVIAALIAGVTTLSFYGSFPPIKLTSAVLLFVMAGVAWVAAGAVKKRIDDGGVGFDRSQMQPTTVASWMLYGKALAWIGALLAGLYVGMGAYIIPQAGNLSAAQADMPGVVAGFVGALAGAVAGVRLERACEAPPADGACTSAEGAA
ncbi:DUF3180 domain-containing protein [Corynebacterium auriscanis]|uniref:DUF3180 domain-containing protein n=1 Tax=Corynebacterium auriscanis TaxID=99807 RepID=UPI0022478776|nr:DUF3180 domain-containing protein [Corynebacterium auriscanis]MCX2163474.1 DUF3180 domain-containing protein [Corynebacterium auriscanis]